VIIIFVQSQDVLLEVLFLRSKGFISLINKENMCMASKNELSLAKYLAKKEKERKQKSLLMDGTLCFKDDDCPNIGYKCYGLKLFQLSGPGICHCWSALALFGNECHSKIYSKIGCCLMFSICSALLLFSVHYFVRNIHRLSFNAFTTTLLQIILGLLSMCIGYGLCIDRVFDPGSHAFWKLKAYYYFGCAGDIHGITSALNISLMWIEIAGFQQLKIVQNVQKTKTILLTVMISLHIELLVLGLILGGFRILQLFCSFYILFLVVTFLHGSFRMYAVLNPTHSETYTDERRAIESNSEIKRIFLTTMAVCLLFVLFLIVSLTYLETIRLGSPALSFFTFHGMHCCSLCLHFVLLRHLQGGSLLPWHPLSWMKASVNNIFSALGNGQKVTVVPLKDESDWKMNHPSQSDAL